MAGRKVPPRPTCATQRLPRCKRERWSGGGLRTAMAIAELWGVGVADLRRVVGSPSRRKWKRWTSQAEAQEPVAIPEALLLRLGIVLNIYAALRSLHVTDEEMADWLARTHDAEPFCGAAPLAVLVSGSRHRQETMLHVLRAKSTGLHLQPGAANFEQSSTEYEVLFADAAL